ncbi:ABC transporter permease [Microbacterium sp. YY-01]|uniref:ABC transporter permease n=1 Tax=Microbacterium sp. YY-01 TaxID=3421634 RepID=UPI003D165D2F
MTTVAHASSAPLRFVRQFRSVSFWAEWAAVVGLIVLTLVFTILEPTFLSSGNVRSMLQASSILVILVVGQTFVILTAGIDLSIASVMTLAAIAFGLAMAAGVPFAVSSLIAVGAGFLAGLANGIFIAKARITDFIVTLGMLSAASGVALVTSDGKPTTVIEPLLLRLATRGWGLIPFTFMIALAIAVVAHIVLFRTRFGTHVLATGGSVDAAKATGIRTDRIKLAVYIIAGVLAGIAAILLVGRVGAAEPAANTTFLLNSVAAVVLGGVSLFGGKGNIIGPLCGALLLTVLTNGLTMLGVSQFYQPLAVGLVVIGAAYLTRFQK